MILWRGFSVHFSALCVSYTPMICYPGGLLRVKIQVDAYLMDYVVVTLETDMTLEYLLPFIRRLPLLGQKS